MNGQTIDKLWNDVPGVKDVVGKENAVQEYQRLTQEAIKKGKLIVGDSCRLSFRVSQSDFQTVELKQGNNSYELDAANNKIGACEQKIMKFQKERKKLESQVANLLAQENAESKKMESIENFEVATLKEEAVALTNETLELQEVESALARTVKQEMGDRFLGENGDGSATYLRNIHGLASTSDVDQLNGLQRRSRLTFAAAHGGETMASWVRKWENPPMENWTRNMGTKPGTILCNNGVQTKQAGDIMFHLYDLSPVDSPPKSRKRSASRGRPTSRGRSQSGSRKKSRLSVEAIEAISAGVTKSLIQQLDESESEEEKEATVA